MNYNFDQIIPREGTNCEKFDHREQIFGRADVIPLWVADMDFTSPEPVIEAIRRRAEHPIFGYSFRSPSYLQAIVSWLERRGGWSIPTAWIDFSPGVVSGVVFALRAFTKEGDGIVIQQPVYHPFAREIKSNNRRMIDNPLREENGRYSIDFEDLDRKLADAKVFLMCNPHNPSGRVFTREELTRIGELCVKHDVLILSDEIHSDLVYAPNCHLHIASLNEAFAQRTITLLAPSKTFNLAGLSTSVIITPCDTLRQQLRAELGKLHADQGNIFGAVALEAAYTQGDEWLDQLKTYLSGNIDYVVDFVQENIPSIRCQRPEGTYLMWLDFRAWPLQGEALHRFLVDQVGLAMNEGSMFGPQGLGWMRMNIGCRRAVLTEALTRLAAAIPK